MTILFESIIKTNLHMRLLRKIHWENKWINEIWVHFCEDWSKRGV